MYVCICGMVHTCVVDGMAVVFWDGSATVWPCTWPADQSSSQCCATRHVPSQASAECRQRAACSGICGTSSATACCTSGVRGIYSGSYEGNDTARSSICWRSNVCCRCTSPRHAAYYHCSWGNNIWLFVAFYVCSSLLHMTVR